MERVWDSMTSDLMMDVLLVFSVLAILFGVLMFIGIKYKGKVVIINSLFKKKRFDQENLLKKYTVQAVYTVFIGVLLYVLVSYEPVSRSSIWTILLFIAVLDGLYDYFAIKSSIDK